MTSKKREAEIEALNKKHEAFNIELEALLEKYDAEIQQTYDGGTLIFNNMNQGDRDIYL